MAPPPDRPLSGGRIATYRHPASVRVAHWLNVACMVVLLMSGLQIFNAHPALYLGDRSTFAQPLMAIRGVETPEFDIRGVTYLFGKAMPTTGWLGAFTVEGDPVTRAFPPWVTLPPNQDLATGRVWHFFFAWVFVLNGLAYLALGLRGRIRRELLPTREDLRGFGASLVEHARLRFPRGEAARRYNVLQKLAYVVVLFGLAPLILATGLSMSPGLNAALPWLPELFGGRQSARTLHFVVAFGFVLFTLVHVLMVVLAGPFNEMRSMITGRYVIKPERRP